MAGNKWVRVEPPEVINIRLTIKKDKYPEIYEWLSKLPLGTITPEVRKALEYYIKSTRGSKSPKRNPSEEVISEAEPTLNSTGRSESTNKATSQSEKVSKREKELNPSKDDRNRQDQDKERKRRNREILMRQLDY